MAGESKTEKATPKKRRDERKKGNVFLSKDAVSVATLFAAIVALRVAFVPMAESIAEFLSYCFGLTVTAADGVDETVLTRSVVLLAKTVLPVAAAVLLSAVVATFAQTRMLVAGALLKPKFERINPGRGFKQLFSLKSLVEAAKGLIKIAVLLVLIYSCLKDMMTVSVRYLHADISGACSNLLGTIFSLFLKVAVAFLVLAALDFMYQWWDYERQMKMSKQEVKEEYKQTEGDPQVKSRIKEIQRKMAQSRMMQQVPGADVIIRNPTHVAVALRYHTGEDEAPVVLAKGLDELALRIVKVGEESDVPVIENVAVARALYAGAEVNRQIPPELYEPVAEVLVYLYKLGKLKT